VEEAHETTAMQSNNTHLIEQKRKLEISLIDLKQELSTLESDFMVTKDQFVRNQEFHNSLLAQHRDLTERRAHLMKIHRETMDSGSQVDSIRRQIADAKRQRSELQDQYTSLIQQPFFRKGAEDMDLRQLERISKQIDEKTLAVDKSRKKILKYEE
jgi:chromosome segregation ATPase